MLSDIPPDSEIPHPLLFRGLQTYAPLPSVSSLIIMLSLRNRATSSTLRACLLFNCKLRSLFWIFSAFLNFLVKPGQFSVYIQLQKLSLSLFLILGSV